MKINLQYSFPNLMYENSMNMRMLSILPSTIAILASASAARHKTGIHHSDWRFEAVTRWLWIKRHVHVFESILLWKLLPKYHIFFYTYSSYMCADSYGIIPLSSRRQADRQAGKSGEQVKKMAGCLYCGAHLVLCVHIGTKVQEKIRTLQCLKFNSINIWLLF